MNPCFFLLNPTTNQIEFHSRSLKSTSVPHKFNIIPYVPQKFETDGFRTWDKLSYNWKFVYQGLTNTNLKTKMFEFDKQHVKKYRNDLLGLSVIIPSAFFWIYRNSQKQALKFPEKYPFTCSRLYMPLICVTTLILSGSLAYFKLKQTSLFLTGMRDKKKASSTRKPYPLESTTTQPMNRSFRKNWKNLDFTLWEIPSRVTKMLYII